MYQQLMDDMCDSKLDDPARICFKSEYNVKQVIAWQTNVYTINPILLRIYKDYMFGNAAYLNLDGMKESMKDVSTADGDHNDHPLLLFLRETGVTD